MKTMTATTQIVSEYLRSGSATIGLNEKVAIQDELARLTRGEATEMWATLTAGERQIMVWVVSCTLDPMSASELIGAGMLVEATERARWQLREENAALAAREAAVAAREAEIEAELATARQMRAEACKLAADLAMAAKYSRQAEQADLLRDEVAELKAQLGRVKAAMYGY